MRPEKNAAKTKARQCEAENEAKAKNHEAEAENRARECEAENKAEAKELLWGQSQKPWGCKKRL